MQQHNAVTGQHMDAAFASVYGPVLAARRERFLRDEHPAWVVFGDWLRPQIRDQGAPVAGIPLRALFQGMIHLLAACVFFDYDLCEAAAKEGVLGCMIEEQRWRDLRRRPMLTLLLHIRPHVRF